MSIDFAGRPIGSNIDMSKYLTTNNAERLFINEDGDKMSGPLDMNNHNILNIPEPKDIIDFVN